MITNRYAAHFAPESKKLRPPTRTGAPVYTLREYLSARFLASVARHGTVVLRSYASKQTKIYLPRVPTTLGRLFVK